MDRLDLTNFLRGQEHIYFELPIPVSKKNGRSTQRSTGRSFNSKGFNRWFKEALNSYTFGLMNLETSSEYCTDIHEDTIEFAGVVDMVFYMPNNLRRDLDNGATSILDFLHNKKVSILKDDSWQICPNLFSRCKGVDKENPRVELTIVEHECIF